MYEDGDVFDGGFYDPKPGYMQVVGKNGKPKKVRGLNCKGSDKFMKCCGWRIRNKGGSSMSRSRGLNQHLDNKDVHKDHGIVDYDPKSEWVKFQDENGAITKYRKTDLRYVPKRTAQPFLLGKRKHVVNKEALDKALMNSKGKEEERFMVPLADTELAERLWKYNNSYSK